jgi:hypothetical protein
MPLKYVDKVLVKEQERLAKELLFLNNVGPEPSYTDFENAGDYTHLTRAAWEGYMVPDSFTEKKYSNAGQMIQRRERTDHLMCLNRAMVMQTFTRSDYYETQAAMTVTDINRVELDMVNYTKAISSCFPRPI